MGRYVKNFETPTNAHAVRMPVGTSLVAPDNPTNGMVRYNAEYDRLEYFVIDTWRVLSRTGTVPVVKDDVVADGTSVSYGPMSYAYANGRETDILVFVGNVFQNPGVAYTLNGNFIDFTSTPPAGDRIVILHNFNSTDVDKIVP